MNAWPRLIAGSVALLLSGCGSTPSASVDDPAVSDRISQTGLVAERWRVPSDSGIVETIFADAASTAMNVRGVVTMRSDGFRCAVAELADVERMLRTDAGDGLAGRTWHGEATTWRTLIGRRTQRGTVLLVDGRARRLPESIVSIEIRGWSLPTVEDAVIQLQVVPVVTTVAGTRIDASPLPPGRLRGTPLSTALESTLRPGQCLLIASVPKLQTPDGDDATSDAAGTEPRSRAPGIGTGPAGSLPATIAGWLLEDTLANTENLIIIHGRPRAGTRVARTPPA